MISIIHSCLNSALFRFIARLQFFVAIGIFTYAALMPANQLGQVRCDVCLHFTGNFLLILSVYVATFWQHKNWILFAGILPYSFAIELSQHFTNSRQVDPRDMMANVAGLLTGYLLALLVEFIWQRLTAEVRNGG